MPAGIAIPEPREAIPHPMADAFAGHREDRRRRRAPAGAARRRAAITIVHNEPVFLPIWLAYYSQFFGPDDLYVLDHDTDDGSTGGGGFVRIPVSHDTIDHAWMVRTVEELQHELLDRYDAVVVTDVDEIVAPDPALGTLGDYMDRLDEESVNCLGYELIHLVDREPRFDPSRSVLDQRGYWYANVIYDKPALATAPVRWKPGFHRLEDAPVRLDPDLRLIHLHRMDYELCLARHNYRRGRAWNEQDVALGWAKHNRITAEADFARWFYEDSNFDYMPIVVEPIPRTWRALF